MSDFRENFSQNNFDLVRLFAASQVMFALHGTYFLMPRHIHLLTFDILDFSIRPFYFLKDFHGVPIFFAVSGFLISASFERARNLRAYFTNRLLRIYPALWVCLLVTIGVIYWVGTSFSRVDFLKWFAAQASFLQCYNPEFLRGFGIGNDKPWYFGTFLHPNEFRGKGVANGSLWTIGVELQFYCFFPALWLGLKRVLKRAPSPKDALAVFIFFFLLALLLHYVVSPRIESATVKYMIGQTFLPHFFLFSLGWALQRNMETLEKFFVGKGLWWLGGYFAFLCALDYSAGYTYIMKEPWAQVILGCMAVSLAYTGRGLARKLLRGNDISYGVYIYHMVVINVFSELFWRGSGWWVCAMMGTTYLLAFLSWRFVEKPCLALKKITLKKIVKQQ
jgi:peptidoglycan/LPS O-acetylase OafA/YrhL